MKPLRRMRTLPFWACLLFHCGLSTKAIAQLPGACPIQIANQSSEKLMFYLLESGAKLDSLTLEPFTVGCMQPPVTQTSLELGMNRAKYTFPFFKDKDQPVRIAFLGGWNFKVEGSRLDSMWRTAIGLQDSPEAGIAFSLERFESQGFQSFSAMLRTDTALAIRFLNNYVPQLKKKVQHGPIFFPSPVYMDSLIRQVRGLEPPQEKLLGDLIDLSQRRPGTDFYHFDYGGIDGDTLNTASIFERYKGKKILVDFWASWCSPCRRKNQTLKQHYAEILANNIQIVGFTLDDNPSDWKKALQEDQIPWYQGLILPEQKETILKRFFCAGVPHTLLFSEEGKLLFLHPSLEVLLKH